MSTESIAIYWIEGDGIGPEIWNVTRPVLDAVVEREFNGTRRLEWRELLAGEKAVKEAGSPLPEATLEALRNATLAMKGPLGTPVGGGIRSLNVALRHALDLYTCIRPIQHYGNLKTPVRHPERINIVVFRENTEDVYFGPEYPAESVEAMRVIELLHDMGCNILPNAGIGIKSISPQNTKRLVRKAIRFALDNNLPSVTLMHKGNIMKYTEGAFRKWGYELVEEEFSDVTCTESNPQEGKLLIKDRIADAMFQEALLHPENYHVIATSNLNGDYISDALAAEVGGLGIAPGVNMSDTLAFYESIHGTAPNIAGKDKANPCSLLLCGVMLFKHLGWHGAADRLRNALETTLSSGLVTEDLASNMSNAKILGCKAFGEAVAERIQ